MRKAVVILLLTIVPWLIGCGSGQKESAQEILNRVVANYQSMETFQSEGTINVDMKMNGKAVKVSTSFSMRLKKPNMYLISWEQKNEAMEALGVSMKNNGFVWSDGSQPFLYMGIRGFYTKMDSDAMALGAATGISGGAANTVPALFFPFEGFPSGLGRVKNPKVVKTEKIDGEECHVIEGDSEIYRGETFWVSKSRNVILKYSHTMEISGQVQGAAKMTDDQIEESLKAMGEEVTEEKKENMRQMMDKAGEALKNMGMSGSSVEVHTNISSPELGEGDFQPDLPTDAVLKESFMGAVMDKMNF
ncbi:DUF2092 domain-containing protein [bacterium]|nr:DUF2092 domain-containing protein [bacterium]